MGESIWCNIRIATPKSWGDDEEKIPGVVLLTAGLYEMLDIEEAWPDRNIWSSSGEGNYGLSDDGIRAALSWCAEHGVPYHASSDPKYEMCGEIEVFDGHTLHEREGDSDGCVTLGQYLWEDLKKQWAHAPVGVIAAVDAHFTLPDIYTVDLSHLPEVIPSDDPDENVDDQQAVL